MQKNICEELCTGAYQHSEHLWLLKEKAIWCSLSKSLFIADTHFGKAGHFRKAGIAIPESVHLEDYKTIESLVKQFNPSHFFFLGDLFHSSINAQWLKLEEFLEGFEKVQFTLVKGNHDILPKNIYNSSCIQIQEEPVGWGSLFLSHEPMEAVPDGKLNLCGHLHPGVGLTSGATQKLKLPCFYESGSRLVLPAFGKFTGLWQVPAKATDGLYLVSPTRVIPFNFSK